MTASPDTNAEMSAYWDGERGEAWVARADQFDRQLEIYGLRAVSSAAPQPGETVIDIGCGAGATSFEASQAVGSTGKVLGIDISRPMLAVARQRAQAEAYTHVEFVHGDAQTMEPPSDLANVIVSRFGVMFFDDPVAAFTNIAAMTVAGGRLAFVCWGPMEANEWMWVPGLAVSGILPMPPAGDPSAPGPFAFHDPERVESILTTAGWEDVTFEDVNEPTYLGGPGSVEDTVDFVITSSSMATALLERSDDDVAEVRRILTETFTPQHDGVGVRYPALARVVHAVKAD